MHVEDCEHKIKMHFYILKTSEFNVVLNENIASLSWLCSLYDALIS